jgi:hypothetical protein
MLAEFWLGNLKGRDQLEYVNLDGRMLLDRTLEKYNSKAWTAIAQDRDQFRILVNTVMNLRVS